MKIQSEHLIKKYRDKKGKLNFLCKDCSNYTCCYDEKTDEMITTALECQEYNPLEQKP